MFALRGDNGDGCVGRKANGGLDEGERKDDVASIVLIFGDYEKRRCCC